MSKLFPIGIEVEEVAVGSVLRILNKTPGVAKLHLNLMNENVDTTEVEVSQGSTTVPQAVLPPVRKPKEGSLQSVVAAALETAPLHRSLLLEVIKRNGYAETSLASQLTLMVGNGYIKKIAPGTYRITDRGLRHYGLAAKRPATNPLAIRETNNGYGVRKLVLTSLVNAPQLLASDLRKILQENNYSPKNMTGTVGKMKGEGLITSDGGVYSITEQGRSVLKGNGSALSTETHLES